MTESVTSGMGRRSVLKIGDCVKLSTQNATDSSTIILCAEGMITDDVFALKNPNGLFENAEFMILPQRHYLLFGSQDTELDSNSNGDEALEASWSAGLGSPVHFGDIVQLRHLISRKFICGTLQRETTHDGGDYFKVSLRLGGNQGSWFEVLPRYKHDRLGNPITCSSHVLLRSVLTNRYLDVVPTRDVHTVNMPRGVNLSLSKASWTMRVSRREQKASAATAHRICPGHLVSVTDSEHGSRLKVSAMRLSEDGDQALYLKTRMDSTLVEGIQGCDIIGSADLSTLWMIETSSSFVEMNDRVINHENSTTDEIRWESDTICLRDVTTGLYLAHRYSCEDDTDISAIDREIIFCGTKVPTASSCLFQIVPLSTATSANPFLLTCSAVSLRGALSKAALTPAGINRASSASNGSERMRGFSIMNVEDHSESTSESFWFEVNKEGDGEALCGLRAACYLRVFQALLCTFEVTAASHELRTFEHILNRIQGHIRGGDANISAEDCSRKFKEPLDSDKFVVSLQMTFCEQGVLDALLDILEFTANVNHGVKLSVGQRNASGDTEVKCIDADSLNMLIEKVPFEVGFVISAVKATLISGTSFAKALADNVIESGVSPPGLIYFAARRGMSSSQHELSADAVLNRTSKSCLRLLLDLLFKNRANQQHAAHRLHVILAHIRRHRLAVLCFLEMTRANMAVSESQVDGEVVRYFLKMLSEKESSSPAALRLLRSICLCNGKAFKMNQRMVFNAITAEDGLLETMCEIETCDGDVPEYVLMEETLPANQGALSTAGIVTGLRMDYFHFEEARPLGDAHSRRRSFSKSIMSGIDASQYDEVLGSSLLMRGIPPLRVTLRSYDGAVGRTVVIRMDRDSAKSQVAKPNLTKNVLDWNDKSHAQNNSVSKSENSENNSRHAEIDFDHLEAMLSLVSALSAGRNQAIIAPLSRLYSFEVLAALTVLTGAPHGVRAAACSCLRNMYIDVDPRTALSLPRLYRTIKSLDGAEKQGNCFAVLKKIAFEYLPHCLAGDDKYQKLSSNLSCEMADLVNDLLRLGQVSDHKQIMCLADAIVEALLLETCHVGDESDVCTSELGQNLGRWVAQRSLSSQAAWSSGVEAVISTPMRAKRALRSRNMVADDRRMRMLRFYLKSLVFVKDKRSPEGSSFYSMTFDNFLVGFLNSLSVFFIIIALVIGSIVVAGLEIYGQGDKDSLRRFDVVVTTVFSVELGLRFYGHLQLFGTVDELIANPYFLIDALVVVLAIIELATSASSHVTSVFRVLRLVRLLRFIKAADMLRNLEVERRKALVTWQAPKKWATDDQSSKMNVMAKMVRSLLLIQRQAADYDLSVVMKAFVRWRNEGESSLPIVAYRSTLAETRRITFPYILSSVLLNVIMYDDDAVSREALTLLHALFGEGDTLLKNAERAMIVTEPELVTIFETSSALILDVQGLLTEYFEAVSHLLMSESVVDAVPRINRIVPDAIEKLEKLRDLCQTRKRPSFIDPHSLFACEDACVWPHKVAQDIIRNCDISTLISQFSRLRYLRPGAAGALRRNPSDLGNVMATAGTAFTSSLDDLDVRLCFALNSFFAWFAVDNRSNQAVLFPHLHIWITTIDNCRGSASVLSAIVWGNASLSKQLSLEVIDRLCEGVVKEDYRCACMEALAGIAMTPSSGSSAAASNPVIDRLAKCLKLPNFRRAAFFWCDAKATEGYEARADVMVRQQFVPHLVNDYSRRTLAEQMFVTHAYALQILASTDLGSLELFTIYPHEFIVDAVVDSRTSPFLRDIMLRILTSGLSSTKPQVRFLHCSDSLLRLLPHINEEMTKITGSEKGKQSGVSSVSGSLKVRQSQPETSTAVLALLESAPNIADRNAVAQGSSAKPKDFLIHAIAFVIAFFKNFSESFASVADNLYEDRAVFVGSSFPITCMPRYDIFKAIDNLFTTIVSLHKQRLSRRVKHELRRCRRVMLPIASANCVRNIDISVAEDSDDEDHDDDFTSGAINVSPDISSKSNTITLQLRRITASRFPSFVNGKTSSSPSSPWYDAERQHVVHHLFLEKFLPGLAALRSSPAELMARLILALPSVHDPLSAETIRSEIFIKKLVTFVRRSIVASGDGSRSVSAPAAEVVRWVQRSLRTTIELTWDPQAESGMSLEERHLHIGHLASEQAVKDLQDVYQAEGCIEMCVDLMRPSVDVDIANEAACLLTGILFRSGGNRQAQEVLHNLLNDRDSSAFFLQLQQMLGVTRSWCLELSRREEHEEEAPCGKPLAPLPRPQDTIVLQLIRLMCVGNFQPSKHLLRVQSKYNISSVNIVALLVQFIDEVSQCGRSTAAGTEMTLVIFGVIRELLLGPSSGNQDFIINQTDFVNALNRVLFIHGMNAGVERSSAAAEASADLVGKIPKLLLCCLEGQSSRSPAHFRILNSISYSTLQHVITPHAYKTELLMRKFSPVQRNFLILIRILLEQDIVRPAQLGLVPKVVRAAFEEVVYIEIFFRGKLRRHYFSFPNYYRSPMLKELSHLHKHINNSSQEKKMEEFIAASKSIRCDLRHQSYLRKHGLALFVSVKTEERLLVIKFLNACALNVLMLIAFKVDHHTNETHMAMYEDVSDGLLILQLLLSIAMLILFAIARVPVNFQQILNQVGEKRVGRALRTALLEPTFVYHGIQLLLVIISMSVSKLAVAFFTLDIIHVSSTTRDVLRAIYRPARQLITTMFLAALALNIFAAYAFFKYRDDFEEHYINEEACYTWWGCLRVFMTYSLRLDAGIAYYMTFNNSLRAFTLDVPVFIIVNLLFVDITFGVIVETFAELRAEKEKREAEKMGKCFICGISAQVFDNNMLMGGQSQGFRHHFLHSHNAIHYMAFIVKILEQDMRFDDGVEHYVRRCLKNNDVSWLPIHQALTITDPGRSSSAGSTHDRNGTNYTSEPTDGLQVQRPISIPENDVSSPMHTDEQSGGVGAELSAISLKLLQGISKQQTVITTQLDVIATSLQSNGRVASRTPSFELISPRRTNISVEREDEPARMHFRP